MNSSVEQVTREAYRRWAPIYPPTAHNPFMRAEQRALLALLPPISGLRVLDLACGSGRYARLLEALGADQVVAVDRVIDMMRAGASHLRASGACATMTALPFASARFDLIVCGLALGHAVDLAAWYREVSRVLKPNGYLVYSDFHPAAARAGLTRSFKDAGGTIVVPHITHELAEQHLAARAAGLQIETVREVRVGIELNETFERCESFYAERHGLPIALIVRARRCA